MDGESIASLGRVDWQRWDPCLPLQKERLESFQAWWWRLGLLAVEGRVGKLGGAAISRGGRGEFLQVGEKLLLCSCLQCQLADVEQEKEGQF